MATFACVIGIWLGAYGIGMVLAIMLTATVNENEEYYND